MILLHIIVFSPSAIANTLFLIFGGGESNIVAYLDNIAIWLVAYGTANVGMVCFAWGFVFFLFQWFLNIHSSAYLLLVIFYVAFAVYTEWFQITKGVEVIQKI